MILSALVAVLLTAGEPAGAAVQATTSGAASKAPEAAPALDPGQNPRDFDRPPPASPEDQALWQATHDVNSDVPIACGQAAQLQFRAKAHDDRLELLDKNGGEDSKRVAVARRRLDPPLQASIALLSGQTPVGTTRVCQYPLLTFEGVLLSREGSTKERQLPDARRDVQQCLASARALLGELMRTNRDLATVLAELDREVPAVVPGGSAKPVSARPSAAAER